MKLSTAFMNPVLADAFRRIEPGYRGKPSRGAASALPRIPAPLSPAPAVAGAA